MMKTKYGVDWLKVNFIGIEGTIESLRHMAAYFGDPALIQRTEEVIAEELAEIQDQVEAYKARLNGKTAALFVGGSRSHHYQGLLKELGVSTVLAGYEFGHRDDYEGREIIPTIKEDADSKNIEHLDVTKDEQKYHAFLTQEQYDKLAAEIPLEKYAGMVKDMDEGSYVVDDLNMYEADKFVEVLKPDIFFSGIKDKYALQKAGLSRASCTAMTTAAPTRLQGRRAVWPRRLHGLLHPGVAHGHPALEDARHPARLCGR